MTATQTVIEPQPGFQTNFAGSPADITIGGGSAGCGKTAVALRCAARFFKVPAYSAVFFRRTTVQIKNPDGLWDESRKVYPLLGAIPNQQDLEWKWKAFASKVKMAHLEHETTVENWQGAASPLFVFDELTHFSQYMFLYFLSRNRSTCGVRPHMLATCNPDADSWVAEFIEWWINQQELREDGGPNPLYGFPIPERAGKLRYFMRVNDKMIWGSTRREVVADRSAVNALETAMKFSGLNWRQACEFLIKSLTFIPGKLEENKILERANPGYRGGLMAMTRVERARLLEGNWKVRQSAGEMFKRTEVTLLDSIPDDVEEWVRCWDLAATEPSDKNQNPDLTAGVLLGRRKLAETGAQRFVVANVIMMAKRSEEVRQLILRTARNDTGKVRIRLFQDPGQAGKDQAQSYISMLAGFRVHAETVSGNKVTNAEPFSAQWQAGRVDVVRGIWNNEYFGYMEGFPDPKVHDDVVDASATAFKDLTGTRPVIGLRW